MPFHNVHGVYPARNCIECGKLFIPKTANHWCCSPECSHKHANKLENARSRQRRADKKKKKTPADSMAEIRAIAKHGVNYGQIVVEMERRGEL